MAAMFWINVSTYMHILSIASCHCICKEPEPTEAQGSQNWHDTGMKTSRVIMTQGWEILVLSLTQGLASRAVYCTQGWNEHLVHVVRWSWHSTGHCNTPAFPRCCTGIPCIFPTWQRRAVASPWKHGTSWKPVASGCWWNKQHIHVFLMNTGIYSIGECF